MTIHQSIESKLFSPLLPFILSAMTISIVLLYSSQNCLCCVRRNFMQEMLNKMVSSVRHGVLGPDDASRAIHECAALLNLQLASDLPVTTVIITGMRKMATAADVIDAFREFGEIDDAAVASNQRGFGRFHACCLVFLFNFFVSDLWLWLLNLRVGAVQDTKIS